MTDIQLVSLPDVAKARGISEGLLRYYLHTGRTPEPVKLSGNYYFDAAEIADWQPEKRKTGRKKQNTETPRRDSTERRHPTPTKESTMNPEPAPAPEPDSDAA